MARKSGNAATPAAQQGFGWRTWLRRPGTAPLSHVLVMERDGTLQPASERLLNLPQHRAPQPCCTK